MPYARLQPSWASPSTVASLARANQDQSLEIATRRRVEQPLRELSARMREAQEDERQRIAREFHEGTAQILAGLNLNAAALMQAAPSLDQSVRGMVSEIGELSIKAIRSMCTLSRFIRFADADARARRLDFRVATIRRQFR